MAQDKVSCRFFFAAEAGHNGLFLLLSNEFVVLVVARLSPRDDVVHVAMLGVSGICPGPD